MAPKTNLWDSGSELESGKKNHLHLLWGRRLGPGPYDRSKAPFSLPTLSCSPAAFSVGNSSGEKDNSRLEALEPVRQVSVGLRSFHSSSSLMRSPWKHVSRELVHPANLSPNCYHICTSDHIQNAFRNCHQHYNRHPHQILPHFWDFHLISHIQQSQSKLSQLSIFVFVQHEIHTEAGIQILQDDL